MAGEHLVQPTTTREEEAPAADCEDKPSSLPHRPLDPEQIPEAGSEASEDAEIARLLTLDVTPLALQLPEAAAAAAVEESLQARLFEGQGEALLELGPGPEAGLRAAAERMGAVVEERMSGRVQVIHQRPAANGEAGVRLDVLVRLPPSELRHLNLRVAVIGNVDAGKSTLVGVLVGGALDNGRGSARTRVLRHRHEAETGRTSSISEDQHLGFDLHGRVLNAQAPGA
eukprot:CAMPEP_0206017692 /NCGR_PEP_ID=MMETSP1464-20131121/25558_1 /ASSEMBLY_ACC=CAM_ASM_001124 /TAXON_ID=119497 /ORGANISM="Exanthemachrysis gayraliae, Strain RCC1523" /LENGTH=227 /DNA_ID=CAMNT_0053391539 /DNA_START=68 /DNA_END=748 /DNA_ORIENTATION=+